VFAGINLSCTPIVFPVKFTESSRVSVPWLLLAKDPEEYIDSDCLPEGFLIRDPSKLTKINVNKLWHHWEQRSKNHNTILRFIKAKPDNMLTAPHDKPKCRLHKRPYVEIGDNSDCQVRVYSGRGSGQVRMKVDKGRRQGAGQEVSPAGVGDRLDSTTKDNKR